MPITKGSQAAHERALKAAETRRRNQSNRELDTFIPPGSTGEMAEEMRQYRAAPITRKLRAVKNPRTQKAPSFPKSYHATPTRHVTRDLRMKEPKRKKHTVPAPRSAKAVRAMSNAELEKAYRYWWEGIGRDRSIPIPARMGGELPYTIRDEHRKRAQAGYSELPRIKAHRARRGVKKQRGGK